jgi:hypothetical protein
MCGCEGSVFQIQSILIRYTIPEQDYFALESFCESFRFETDSRDKFIDKYFVECFKGINLSQKFLRFSSLFCSNHKQLNYGLNMEKKEHDVMDSVDPTHSKEQLFAEIGPENSFTELQSLCMNCEEQGVTRLLLTKIPFFRVL